MRTPEPDAAALAELAPRAGSNLYYALLYAPSPLRQALTLIESFRQLMISIPLTCSNLDIAHTKLAWWHEEVERIRDGVPRHALGRALVPWVQAQPALHVALHANVLGITQLLSATRFASRGERFAAYSQTHSALWALHAALSGETSGELLAAAGRVGSLVQISYALNELRWHLDSGMAIITRDSEPPNSPGEQLANAQWYAALAARDIAALQEDLRAAAAALPRGATLRTLKVAAVLALATLAEVAADGHRVWEHRIELTPLRQLWLAWRTRISGGL